MAAQNRSSALLLVALLVAAAVGALFLFGTEPEEGNAVAVGDDFVRPEAEEPAPVEVTVPRELRIADESGAKTTVIWPLEVTLDLVRPSYLPETDEGLQPGVGRRARLTGNIADARGEPVRAEIEFVAGANQGRVLVCRSDGSFGANDLYPGVAVVEVRGRNIPGSRREIVLRQNTEFTLNIGYGRPGGIQGEVLDANGEGIEGAKVIVDGLATTTDAEGYFYLGGLASDRALLEIEAEGFAGLREVVGITADFTIPRGRLIYRLERGADLEVSVTTAIGAREAAHVIVLPPDTKQVRRFPWYRVNPIEVRPGTTVTVRDLPVGPVAVRVFHRGAVASPRERVVNLRSGSPNRVEIDLEPAPMLRGTVVRDGAPVPGSRVTLEAPDRVGATLSWFRTAHWFLESEVLPPFPFAVQEAVTDADGRFAFTAWPEVTDTVYLEAWSPDRTAWEGRMVSSEAGEVTLELAVPQRGRSELVLELPGRTQGLDVELVIDGTPAEPFTLPPDRDLVIDSLLEGVWEVRARWHTDLLLEEPRLELDGRATFRLELPRAAIAGEGREAWERAGRAYPETL